MSVKWISYVWDQTDYREGELLTALALADFANDEGECFPFIETIAKKARLSVRQVQRNIQHFESDGFLEITRHQGRGKRPDFKLKKVTSSTPFSDRKKVTSTTVKGDIDDTEKVTLTTSPIYKDEPSLEPSENTQSARVRETDAVTVADTVFGSPPEPETEAGEQAAYEQTILAGLEERMLCTPFEYPNWRIAIEFAFRQRITPEQFFGCINWLKTAETQKWRRGRLTPETVTNNFSEYLGSAVPAVQQAPRFCPKCEKTSGLFEVEKGIYARCSHQ